MCLGWCLRFGKALHFEGGLIGLGCISLDFSVWRYATTNNETLVLGVCVFCCWPSLLIFTDSQHNPFSDPCSNRSVLSYGDMLHHNV